MLDHFVWSAKAQSYKLDTQLKNHCYVIKAIAMFQFTKVAEYKKKTPKIQKVWLKTGRTKLKKLVLRIVLQIEKCRFMKLLPVHITYA